MITDDEERAYQVWQECLLQARRAQETAVAAIATAAQAAATAEAARIAYQELVKRDGG